MDSLSEAERLYRLVEKTVWPQVWFIAVLAIGIGVMGFVMIRASQRGVPLVGQVLRGAPVAIATVLLAMLAFGPSVLAVVTWRWPLVIAAVLGVWLAYARVLQHLTPWRGSGHQNAHADSVSGHGNRQAGGPDESV
ncbi:MAG: hypothetical protein JXP37_07425 [Coriobacteriia bacterium]|nr:hypothetical protein [Coriobacteriia bacterium]